MNASDLSETPRTGRPRDAPLRRKHTITDGSCTRNILPSQNGSGPAVFAKGVAQITRGYRTNILFKHLIYLWFLSQLFKSLQISKCTAQRGTRMVRDALFANRNRSIWLPSAAQAMRKMHRRTRNPKTKTPAMTRRGSFFKRSDAIGSEVTLDAEVHADRILVAEIVTRRRLRQSS